MKMFELLPRPLGSIFRKLTHLTCNSPLPRILPCAALPSSVRLYRPLKRLGLTPRWIWRFAGAHGYHRLKRK